ncbi:GCN5-related N-acetyltransferase [Ketogulonicigenium robustum]|uniref:GCN5-related N-acetyltransferase n=1 Tax=Ketogulonicigenium robustum TaxID=92947 RepID=A0A1W6NWU6_9RHOB|nr:GNAT family N-acetyltransferase [Ketogulonicigenium robustum]ARO13671.1 GCN5-related N-acetyltransferase [Ketogulonicigenium robustum]
MLDLMEPTWPPAARVQQGALVLRQGQGGGSRVSAITRAGTPRDALAALPEAETIVRGWGQTPLYMLSDGDADDDALAALLQARGYQKTDAVFIFDGPLPVAALPTDAALRLSYGWPADAAALAAWANDGRVGDARMAVMARAQGPKTVIALSDNGKPVGALFIAVHAGAAVLHALEVVPAARGRGYSHVLLGAASHWAATQGAQRMLLVVSKDNTPAVTLYLRHGLQAVGGYYYLGAV